jgi:AcrR family transcriptional regulator
MLGVMATRPYTTAQRRTTPESVNRVLDAAERLIREDWFHTATMDELAAAAGVSRATVFNRFGSKLGVLQALFTRAMEGPQMNAIREALEIEDPEAALEAAIAASCAIWDREGYIHEHLQAIAILEPDARALIDEQKQDQRAGLQTLVRRLSKARRLRQGLGEPRALATLHTLTSLETFHWLRRDYGLSLRQTRDTITALARTVLRD